MDKRAMKEEYELLTKEYRKMKEIYDQISWIVFKKPETKEQFKKLGVKMYQTNLKQITLLQKMQGLNI